LIIKDLYIKVCFKFKKAEVQKNRVKLNVILLF